MSSVITALEDERLVVLKQIDSLKRELAIIDRLLMQKKAEKLGQVSQVPVNRKNVSRIYAESLIIEVLASTEKGLTTGEVVRAVSKKHNIPAPTMRSHLARMRDKKIIRKSSANRWGLVNNVFV